jgi:hypothetical protein
VGAGTFSIFRAKLAEARAAGVPFDVAWRRSFPRSAGRGGRQALEETREGWRRAYVGEPATQPERALTLVGHLLAEGDGEREAPPVVGVRVG